MNRKIGVAIQPSYASFLRNFGQPETFSFPISNITREIMWRARNAIYREFGEPPAYYIVGLHTFYELHHKPATRDEGFDDLVVDTSREHYFAAVSTADRQIGRPLPAGSVWAWTQDCGWVPNE